MLVVVAPVVAPMVTPMATPVEAVAGGVVESSSKSSWMAGKVSSVQVMTGDAESTPSDGMLVWWLSVVGVAGVAAGGPGTTRASRHPAPIGNLGIRTHATRHDDDTIHLESLGVVASAGGLSTFLDDDLHRGAARRGRRLHQRGSSASGTVRGPRGVLLQRRRWCERDAHAQRTGESARWHVTGHHVREHDAARIAFARELSEPHPMHARQRWRAIDDDERKDPTAQQQIGGPRTPLLIGWTDDDEPLPEVGPRGRRERTPRVDPGHPAPGVQHPRHHLPEERRFTDRERAGEFGDAPAGNAATQRGIQPREPGGPGCSRGPTADNDGFELGAEWSEGRGRHRFRNIPEQSPKI